MSGGDRQVGFDRMFVALHASASTFDQIAQGLGASVSEAALRPTPRWAELMSPFLDPDFEFNGPLVRTGRRATAHPCWGQGAGDGRAACQPPARL